MLYYLYFDTHVKNVSYLSEAVWDLGLFKYSNSLRSTFKDSITVGDISSMENTVCIKLRKYLNLEDSAFESHQGCRPHSSLAS